MMNQPNQNIWYWEKVQPWDIMFCIVLHSHTHKRNVCCPSLYVLYREISNYAVLLVQGLYPLERDCPSLSLLCFSLGFQQRKMDVPPADRKWNITTAADSAANYQNTCRTRWTCTLASCMFVWSRSVMLSSAHILAVQDCPILYCAICESSAKIRRLVSSIGSSHLTVGRELKQSLSYLMRHIHFEHTVS